jgi:hypothetical protein
MSLHEVMNKQPAEIATFSQSRLKKIESYLIARKTRRFIADGGKITDCDSGKSTRDFSTMPALINEFSGKLDVDRVAKVINQKKKKSYSTEGEHFYAGENRTRTKSKYGQNIVKTKYDRYTANVGNQHKTFLTNEEAVTWRDDKRKLLGLPPAEY